MKKNITPCPFLSCNKESKVYGWLEITNRCNLKCPYCYADSTVVKKEELSIGKIKELFRDFKKLGAEIVMISGGEPSLRNDLSEILESGVKEGLKIILVTNGTALNPAIIKTLAKNNISVQLSIDSVDADVYAESRGVKLLPKVLKNINSLLKNGVEIYLASTLTRTTRKSLKGLIGFALEKGIQNIHIGEIIPEGRSQRNKKIFIKSPYAIYKELYRLQKENFLFLSIDLIENFVYPLVFASKRRFYCNAMERRTIEIGSDGQAYICGGMRKLMERSDLNVNRNNLDYIYKELKKSYNNFSLPLDRIEGCKDCEFGHICSGGCRAIAYHQKNNLGDKHPYCEDIKRIIRDIIKDLNAGKLDNYRDFLLKTGNFKKKRYFNLRFV